MRFPYRVVLVVSTASVLGSWCLAMHRDVERGLGVLDPILHVLVGGFELPWLTVLSRMGNQLGEFLNRGVSPLPLFVLTGAILFAIWNNGQARQDS